MAASLPHVATLVAAAGDALGPGLVAAARDALAATAPDWLDPDRALDLRFSTDAALAARDRLSAAIGGARVDVFVQADDGHRRKRLFLADMDSTIIGQECIDELADLVGARGPVSAITERAMRGEIAFEPALRERVALLAGLDAGVVGRVLAERITLTPGAVTLVATMRAAGAHTALVSGGFTAFTAEIAARVGFDEHRGNTLIVEDGRFTGRVADPILGQDAKREALLILRAERGLDPRDTLAVGDGANDLAMLLEAGLGVAFHAKPAVAAAAAARVEHGDLTALLFAQGFSRARFA